MVQLNKNFDDSQPTMGDGGFPLQVGEHPFMIISEEVKDTASGNGNQYLQYNCVVDDGPQRGVDFAIRLNFWNSNETAVQIAEREFNTLRIAAGVPATNDSARLINRRAVAVVTQKTKGKNAGEVYISGYNPVGGTVQAAPVAAPVQSAPVQQQVAQPQAAAAPSAATVTAPWHK